MPTWERHAYIYAAFDSLEHGGSLLIVTDHEPRPLRLQLEQVRPRQFIWAQRHLGIGRWDVTLRRILTSDSDVADSRLTFLRRCAVLSEAREETRQAFAQIATERTVDAGTSIVEQDAQWPYLGLVRAGSLGAIIGSTTGREQRLFDVLTCDTFGDIETLHGGRTLARSIATTATRVVLVPRGIVVFAITNDSGFARALAAICAQRARALADALSAQVAQPRDRAGSGRNPSVRTSGGRPLAFTGNTSAHDPSPYCGNSRDCERSRCTGRCGTRSGRCDSTY